MRLLGLVVALAACSKPSPPNATRAECERYRNKLYSLLPEAERQGGAQMGMDKPSKFELDLCEQRVMSDEVACADKATTLTDALACRSKVDIRPEEAIRSPVECKAFSEHVMKLAELVEQNETVGPPFSRSMAQMLAHECDRWMTKERYECVLKSGSPMDLMRCRP